MKSDSHIYHVLIAGLLLSLCSLESHAQTRMILNGANVAMTEGAYLVVENPSPDAITRLDGHIISAGENNRIKWNIGTATGTYTIPWGYGASSYIPVSFTKSTGTGSSGYFIFSTYRTGWQNSTQLPSGVTHLNGASGDDHSAFIIDRFWGIDARDYTIKPSLSNLTFTYRDEEHSAAGNTILESALRPQRWESTSSVWTDSDPAYSINTSANIVEVASVTASDFFQWWTLATRGRNYFWVAPSASTWDGAANWASVSGGSGNAGVPTPLDAVIFNENAPANCTLDTDLNVVSINVQAGYTGTIMQGNRAIVVNGRADFSGGTFQGGNSTITVSGPLVVSGSSFTSTSGILDLKSDFQFSGGAFNHNAGTVRFSGTATQRISGSQAATFHNIDLTNTAASPGLQIQSNQNLAGTLTLAGNTVFDADGSNNTAIFSVLSSADDPTQDGSIGPLPAGARVTGKVTVQRYMSKEGANNGRIYRYISSPVQNGTVADLQKEVPVTGSFTGRSICTGCTTSPSLFRHDETVITDINGSGTIDRNDGYISFPGASNSEMFETGRGYALYVRANLLKTQVWDLQGTVPHANVEPIALPVSYTSSGNNAEDGWNLVGNPFPSAIDWNAGGWTKQNLEQAIYITDNGSVTGTQYASWNGVTGTNGGSRYIAMGQGFWVKANGAGAPVLQADENIKAAGVQAIFFRGETPANLLRITMANGTIRDETVIHFRADATENFDAHADAHKLENTTLNLSSVLNDGKNLSINSQPSFNCESEISLNVGEAAAGNYRLNFSEYESFQEAVTITLWDRFTDKTHDIRNGGYDFSIAADVASYGPERFSLRFSSPVLSPDFQLSAAPVCEGSAVSIQVANSQPGVKYQAFSQDMALPGFADGNGGEITIALPAGSLPAGLHDIAVNASFGFCNAFIEKNIVVPVEKRYHALAEDVKHCQEGPMTLMATGAPENGFYNWYETEGAESPLVSQQSSAFVTASLKKSRTYYVSVVNVLGCEGPRQPVQASVIPVIPAKIVESGDLLRSNHADGNQWYFNGQPIEGATGEFFTAEHSGVYGLEVHTNGCLTSASLHHLVNENEKPRDFVIHLWPNPVNTEAVIEISDSFGPVREVRIINSMGQRLGGVDLEQQEGKKTGKLQFSNYPPGMYIVQVVGSTSIYEEKVIR